MKMNEVPPMIAPTNPAHPTAEQEERIELVGGWYFGPVATLGRRELRRDPGIAGSWGWWKNKDALAFAAALRTSPQQPGDEHSNLKGGDPHSSETNGTDLPRAGNIAQPGASSEVPGSSPEDEWIREGGPPPFHRTTRKTPDMGEDNIVKTVAREICIASGCNPDGSTHDIYIASDPDAGIPWAGFRKEARAAIKPVHEVVRRIVVQHVQRASSLEARDAIIAIVADIDAALAIADAKGTDHVW